MAFRVVVNEVRGTCLRSPIGIVRGRLARVGGTSAYHTIRRMLEDILRDFPFVPPRAASMRVLSAMTHSLPGWASTTRSAIGSTSCTNFDGKPKRSFVAAAARFRRNYRKFQTY